MNTSHVGSISPSEQPYPRRARGRRNTRRLALALIIGACGFGIGGCVTDGYVGVSAYPSYAPYYGYYGYSGVPYYGYGGIYTRNIIVRGQRHSGGYGRQHFSGYRRGRDRAQVSRPSQDRRGNPSNRSSRSRSRP
jgi:hypothetical protein